MEQWLFQWVRIDELFGIRLNDAIFYLQVVHDLRQPTPNGTNPCGETGKAGCKFLCMISPGGLPRYRCGCPDNVHLGKDGKTCFSNCTTGQFKCDNHICISKAWYCDGENDCGDNSDEVNCAVRKCKPGK